MTITHLIAVVSLVLAAFGLGYTIGSNKSQKESPLVTKGDSFYISVLIKYHYGNHEIDTFSS